MAESKINFIGIAIALVAAVATAFLLAILLGIFAGLFGGQFMDASGNISLFVDGLVYLLFVFPPFLICGFVAAHVGHDRKLIHAFVAGVFMLLIMFALAFFPFEESSAMEFSDYFYFVAILPITLLGGWLNARIAS